VFSEGKIREVRNGRKKALGAGRGRIVLKNQQRTTKLKKKEKRMEIGGVGVPLFNGMF